MSRVAGQSEVAHDARPTAPGFAASAWLVAVREILVRLRSVAFVVSTAIIVLAALAAVVIGSVASSNAEPPSVAAVGEARAALAGTDVLQVVDADDTTEAERLLRDGEVDAIVVPDALVPEIVPDAEPGASPVGITVIGLEGPPGSVVQALSVPPNVAVLDPGDQDPALVYFVSLGFGLVFFMSALTFGQIIAQSVVEEKQTRVVEVLLSAIPVRTLLTGKVVGNSVLAFTQIVVISGLALLGLAATGQRVLFGELGPSVLWFIVFFLFGFVMLASLFAAAAAMVSRAEDVGTTTTPVTMLVMIPYFLVVFFNSNETVLAVMSYVPFSAPVGMPVRVFLGTAEWWEPLLSLAILVATTALAILIGSRIYGNALLRMGGRVKLREALGR
ncbi:ABC transporter permease [Agromyces rhizosphaerae]|uniref:ABC transporter permease n=1 Tax=Agromyces rhizosphaerae TaxID=88374 RepID=A0A9W6CR94_9MICO|nr:ABC transporter permease [Agromyces rhizosphaerae]GLI27416.1 ABC transporter permease [Agromyces rhizosphaerae]